jgi:hypothetical protein
MSTETTTAPDGDVITRSDDTIPTPTETKTPPKNPDRSRTMPADAPDRRSVSPNKTGAARPDLES